MIQDEYLLKIVEVTKGGIRLGKVMVSRLDKIKFSNQADLLVKFGIPQ